MRICLISLAPVGGFKSFLENIVSLLLKNNCEVEVLFLSENNKIIIPNVKTFVYDIRKESQNDSDRNLFSAWHFFKKKWYEINKWSRKCALKISILNAQVFFANIVNNCKKVLDLSYYDCVISTEEIGCNYFLANNVIAKRKIGYIHPDYLMAGFDAKIDYYFLKKLDSICAVSESNALSIKKALPFLKNKIIGIQNPVDVDSIIEKSNDIIDDFFSDEYVNLITVCRLDNSSKALDRLLIVAKMLKESDDKFVWRIIGDGSFLVNMKSLIKEYSLEGNVLLYGKKDNPLPYVKKSDLFVLQSYYEGYPMSVCESLIVNTPVLITNYASAKEQVKDGFLGIIVKNNVKDIYEKLHYLINNHNVIAEYRNNLLSTEKKQFNTIDKLIEVCEGRNVSGI